MIRSEVIAAEALARRQPLCFTALSGSAVIEEVLPHEVISRRMAVADTGKDRAEL